MPGEVLRKKLQALPQGSDAGAGAGASRAWRLGFSRAARDMMPVPLDFLRQSMASLSLTEMLDQLPDRGLILMLDGPEDGLGLLVLSPDLLSALIEVLTTGTCSTQAPEPRRPTRTDAAMLSPLADLALANLEEALAEDADLIWTSGFRFASFIEEARSLPLLLEDVPCRLLSARLSLAGGARVGDMLLVLPAEGRGRKPALAVRQSPSAGAGAGFAAGLAARVGSAPCVLDAVLTRLALPLAEVLRLEVGRVLSLPEARLDRLAFEGLDGRAVALGKLGQHRGMRAMRLVAPGAEAADSPAALAASAAFASPAFAPPAFGAAAPPDDVLAAAAALGPTAQAFASGYGPPFDDPPGFEPNPEGFGDFAATGTG